MKVMAKIKMVREERNITQKMMGSALGIAKETYRNIENGRIRLKLDDYIKICLFLDVPPSYFLSEYDDKYIAVLKIDLMNVFELSERVSALKVKTKVFNFEDDEADSDERIYMADSAKDSD